MPKNKTDAPGHDLPSPEKKYETIDVPVVIARVNDLIKEKMKGHYASDNCGYLTEFTINTLTELLLGLPLTNRTISLEPSTETTTPNWIRQGFVKIKKENSNQVIKKQLRVVHSTALRSETGLHSILPYPETSLMQIDDHASREMPYIDLDQDAISKTKVKSFQLHKELTSQAKKTNSIVVGQISLATLGKTPKGHVFAFCATEDTVYFIDGQLYNGITGQGEPIFYDIHSVYNLVTEYEQSVVNGFIDDCFYLIHQRFPLVLQTPVSDETVAISSVEALFEPHEPACNQEVTRGFP